MKECRKFATLLILCLGAVCFSTGVARAQAVSRGTFTLQHKAQWGKHTLPKGDYNYTIRDMGMKGAKLVAIKGTSSSQQFQMMGLERTPAASIKGTDNVVVVNQGTKGNFIRGIYLGSKGLEYVFPDYARKEAVVSEGKEQVVATRLPVRKDGKR